jgi:hypothetical protein
MRLPGASDNLAAYIGLISSAIELAKLRQTETRDLRVIEAHYEIERAKIEVGFRHIETALLMDFESQRAERSSVYEAIKMLIAAGQFELAGEFHKRYVDKLDKGAMARLTDERNAVSARSGTFLQRR